MQDFIVEFTQHLKSIGLEPNEQPIGNDRWSRIRVNGEKNRNLRYQLKVLPDYAMARFVYSLDGESRKWSSSSTSEMTNAEKQRLASRIEADKLANEARRDKEMMEVAEKASRIWNRCSPASEEHPYIKRKKIKPLNIREKRGIIVSPVHYNGGLCSLQFILPDGEKRFLANGRTGGGYGALIFKNDPLDCIVICEGMATAHSIRMATGLPVLYAYFASNIEPVVESAKKKFTDSKIIIAADNDEFTMKYKFSQENKGYKDTPANDPKWIEWRNAGMLHNTGVEKSKQVAKKYGCHVAIPIFSKIDSKPTDFNDLHDIDGLDVVNEQITSARIYEDEPSSGVGGEYISHDGDVEQLPAVPSYLMESPPDHVYEDIYSEETKQVKNLYSDHDTEEKSLSEEEEEGEWSANFQTDSKGKIHPKSLYNADLMLRYSSRFKDLFCYDEFAHEKTLIDCPPWESASKFRVRPIIDEDNTRLAIELEKVGIQPTLPNLKKILDSVVLNKRRHPAREYFSRLEWDGVPRLDTWLRIYCNATHDPEDYLSFVGRKWLVAAVARVFNPGCKFDHMLIFEGKQKAGKSMMLREMSTICGQEYFDDTIKVSDMGSDKTVPKMQGVLIIEIAELSGFRKKDADELKQAITTQRDRIIRKYANEPTEYPRQFVLAGTINPTDGYLHDPTGNRRFWPVRCGDEIDIKQIIRDKEQLWAEAVHVFKQGEKLYLNDEESAIAHIVQEERRTIDAWYSRVESISRNWKYIDAAQMDEIWTSLSIDMKFRDKFASERLGKLLSQLSFYWGRKRVGDKRVSMWIREEETPVNTDTGA